MEPLIGNRKGGEGAEALLYERDAVAGGELKVSMNGKAFDAEYTLFGSGVPVVKSERGTLLSAP